MNKILTIGILLITISSCSGNVKKHWKCDAPKGKGCTSIRDADGLSGNVKQNKNQASYVLKLEPKNESSNTSSSKNFIYTRTKEEAERIWFAPFIDSDGNQHEESYVRVIINKPNWAVTNEIN